MIGIRNIGVYVPKARVDNFRLSEKYGVDTDFIERKVGIRYVSRKPKDEKPSDLCCGAFRDLCKIERGLAEDQIDFLCVCTQNGDYRLPQTSSIVQEKLGLPKYCAAFDVALGCSGYVYSLLIAKSFMEAQSLKCGLVFTSDPYSSIIDPDDRNTSLIFGDAAAVTLLTTDATLDIGKGSYHTDGSVAESLIKRQGGCLEMNGGRIFNFVMRNVPPNIETCMRSNNVASENIDLYLLHQASRYIIDNLLTRMKIDPENVPFKIQDYGNTVSSTLPILLREYILQPTCRMILLSGFGVGLSVASVILKRRTA